MRSTRPYSDARTHKELIIVIICEILHGMCTDAETNSTLINTFNRVRDVSNENAIAVHKRNRICVPNNIETALKQLRERVIYARKEVLEVI